MNINKIREALYWLNDHVATVRGEGWGSAQEKIREALAELDKAQQPGKLLTDEEIERICLHDASPIVPRNQRYGNKQHAAAKALRYARDNGYLAPAAGLTVEEAEQIAVDARIEFDEIAWKSPPISYEKEFRSILKRRLTAAIEAKTNSK